MWKATFKSFLGHKFRLALTTLAVVLGVAFVAGTYVLTDTLNRTFETLFTDVTKGVDVYVRSEGGFAGGSATTRERIPDSLLDQVVAVEGVAYAEGEVAGYAQFVDKEGEAIGSQAPTLGISWPTHRELSPLVVREGRAPQGAGEVAMDASTARKHGFRIGDRVTVLFQGPPQDFEIVAMAGFGEADNLAGATLAAFELATAQRVLGAEGLLDDIAVAAQPGVSPVVLRERIAAGLPKGVEAVGGDVITEEQTNSVKEGLGFISTALLVFAGVALFVGAFIIFNTFNILVTQRTRELGLLRALGASSRQVTRSVLLEGLIVGIVSSGVGLGVGILMAIGLRELLGAFGLEVPTSTLEILPRTIIASFIVGVGVTLLASISPARRAARIAPIAALRDVDAVRPLRPRRRSLAGGVLAGMGVLALLIGLFGGGSSGVQLVGLGVGLTFLGVAVLTPLIARSLAGLIGRPFVRIAAVAGKLGRENAMRNPRRTASTSSALMVGLALVGTFVILGSSIKATVRRTFDETFKADFLVTSATGFMGEYTPLIAEHLRERPEVGTVAQARIGEWREPGSTSTRWLTAVDPAIIDEVLTLQVEQGSIGGLGADGVLIRDDVARDEGIEVGEAIAMEFARSGALRMRVVGMFTQGGFVSDWVMSLEAYEQHYTEQLDHWVLIKAAPGSSLESTRRAVDDVLAAHPNVKVEDQAGARAQQERQVDQLLGLVTALLGLAIVIALLGIVNTLALSVLERTRELGLLRAVGMSRRQVRAMIRWESVIIALLGGALGLAVGSFFGWALVTALSDEGITEFSMPGRQLVVFLVSAGLLGVVAALLPARRASRLDVLQAIAYE